MAPWLKCDHVGWIPLCDNNFYQRQRNDASLMMTNRGERSDTHVFESKFPSSVTGSVALSRRTKFWSEIPGMPPNLEAMATVALCPLVGRLWRVVSRDGSGTDSCCPTSSFKLQASNFKLAL